MIYENAPLNFLSIVFVILGRDCLTFNLVYKLDKSD